MQTTSKCFKFFLQPIWYEEEGSTASILSNAVDHLNLIILTYMIPYVVTTTIRL